MWFIMFSGFVSLYSLVIQVKYLATSEDLQNQVHDDYYPLFLLLNVCMVFSAAIGFGAPFAPVYVRMSRYGSVQNNNTKRNVGPQTSNEVTTTINGSTGSNIE
jgi:hypothetical protein